MLEALEINDNTEEDYCSFEQSQAWILLTVYEFMRTDYRWGWISAGRSFRLVQLMKLYELDDPRIFPPQTLIL